MSGFIYGIVGWLSFGFNCIFSDLCVDEYIYFK